MSNIRNYAEFLEALSYGQWAWPGGYPRYFIMADGEALSFEAAEKNLAEIESAMTRNLLIDMQWVVVACEINYEDSDLYCVHTGDKIPSAYGEDE